MTASPQELTLMLYDGAIKFTNQAKAAIEENDSQKAHALILRVENIITEFRATLDMTYKISESFEMMYEYIYRRLIDANIKKDNNILDEVLGLLRELRDTWKEAMKLAKQQGLESKSIV